MLALALLAAGCQGEGAERLAEVKDQEAYEQLYATADTSAGYNTNAPAPVSPVQSSEGYRGRGPLTATGNLTATTTGGPAGSVTVTESGPGTLVLAKIDRSQPGLRLAATITSGLCTQQAGQQQPVGEPFQVDPQGFATLEARVPLEARTILDGTHSIRIVAPSGSPASVLACADLPALQ